MTVTAAIAADRGVIAAEAGEGGVAAVVEAPVAGVAGDGETVTVGAAVARRRGNSVYFKTSRIDFRR